MVEPSSAFSSLSVAEQLAAVRALPQDVLDQPDVQRLLAELSRLVRGNPLQAFAPHPAREDGYRPQFDFLAAQTPIVAAFAGNRFGKSTSLAVRSLIECVDVSCLPASLRPFKRWFAGENAPDGVFGRVVNPSLGLIPTVMLPPFQKWVPKDQLWGKSWAKAWAKQDRILRFANGSFIEFMAYEQDLDKFGGAARHFVGYDEPPPADIRTECMWRTVDYGGYEMFAMTPLKSNTGWVRRDIWRQREDPDITVVRGSVHDNPTADKKTTARALAAITNEAERRAREFGDFADFGGLVYPDFERSVIDDLPTARVQGWDVVVGIDPGVRNCGITFHGFDSMGVMVTFDERLVKDGTPERYVEVIDDKLSRWGLRREDVSFVIDPAARQRSQVNAETVDSALMRLGVFCEHGQNSVDAGVQQVRSRMMHARYFCFRSCVGLRDEADEYAAEDRDDGEFKIVKTNDHRLDSLRYVAMSRPFFPEEEDAVGESNLGWRPNVAPPSSRLVGTAGSVPPMGSMS